MIASATPVDATSAPGSETNKSFGAPTIVRPGGGKTIRSFGNEIEFKLTTELTGGTLSLGLAGRLAAQHGTSVLLTCPLIRRVPRPAA